MTMTASRTASLRLYPIAALLALAVAPSLCHADAYLGAGLAAFDGAGAFDRTSRGVELLAGMQLRPWLALEGGVLQQDGERRYEDVPAHLTEYAWRAWTVGPRVRHALGQRWHVHAGLSVAHVALERENVTTLYVAGQPVQHSDGGTYASSSWGALARLDVSLDLTSRQRLSLDYRRLHAGLDQVCETVIDEHANGVRCGLLRHRSADGVSLAWDWRFD